MDVTNENFLELLPELTKNIQECDFISMDTELSGLLRERVSNRFDLPEERFAKTVENSRGYVIMQFGLSCFTRLPSDELGYKNTSYNFYIFPQQNAPYGDMNRTFSLQAQAIQFLSEHNFDFNKLFKHGVSYLTFQEKKLLTAQLKADKKARSNVDFNPQNGLPTFVPTQMATNCVNWLSRVQKFVEARVMMDNSDTSQASTQNSDTSTNGLNDSSIRSKEDTYELRDCSTNQKRNIMKRVLECSQLFGCIEIDQKHDPIKKDTFLVVYYINKNLKNEKQSRLLAQAKGFLEIIELIVVNKKPLVGHNLAMDIIQMINQFMEPLSEDYNSFKETCHSLFPLIYDTKYIAHSILDPGTLNNNQSRLNDLYCQLKDSKSTFPKIKVQHCGQAFDENQAAHQAGYDAYMSGYSFIALCEGYIKETKPHKMTKQTNYNNDANQQLVSIAQQCQIIEEFANKIHLSFSYDHKYYNLSGDDEKPKRNHVFYIEFPDTWTLDDIFQVFYHYGGVIACRLNSTSALCALRESKQVASVEKKLINSPPESANYKVLKYETYLNLYRPKKKRGSSGDCGDVEFVTA